MKPVKKKVSIWPYQDKYKGHDLDIFKDGSVIVRGKYAKDVDYAFKDLTEAFEYVDKKEKMKPNYPTAPIQFLNMVTTANTAYTNQYYDECTSLAPCQAEPDCPKASVQKGNNPMYVDNDKHIESSKINYLSDRASCVYYNKANSLTAVFGFTDDEAPATSQELVDRFVSGKFVFRNPDKKDTKGCSYRPLENIQWRDPAKKEDQVGYDAAVAALAILYQDTKDMIAIGTPAEGLAAVKALDAWTPVTA